MSCVCSPAEASTHVDRAGIPHPSGHVCACSIERFLEELPPFLLKKQGLKEFEGEQWGGTWGRVSHAWGQLLLRISEVPRNQVAGFLGSQVPPWPWV